MADLIPEIKNVVDSYDEIRRLDLAAANSALARVAVHTIPPFIAVVEAARAIVAARDLHWSDALVDRVRRENALIVALAAFDPPIPSNAVDIH